MCGLPMLGILSSQRRSLQLDLAQVLGLSLARAHRTWAGGTDMQGLWLLPAGLMTIIWSFGVVSRHVGCRSYLHVCNRVLAKV
jgi:hypothetical protein